MHTHEPLRYVSVRDVEADLGPYGLTVESAQGQEMGRLDGFLVDAGRQVLKYFVISRLEPRSLTLARVPFVPACLDSENGVLRLLDEAPAQALS